MGKVFLLALLAGALALGAVCAPALAQSNSAVDEYQENVPGAGGGPSANEGGQGGGGGGAGGGGGSGSSSGSTGGGGGASLAPETVDQLSEQGSAGAGLSNFTEQTGTAPASSQGSAGGGQGSGGGSGGGSDASGAGSTSTTSSDDEGFFGALGNVLGTFLLGSDADSDSGGLGVVFPILLIAALLGTVALLVTRRRRGGAEPHQG